MDTELQTVAVEPVEDHERFAFGRNWRRFLAHLDDGRIDGAQLALASFLEVETLAGTSFLDAGSGSGLSSLAAHRLGASPLSSFDYDADSVGCTNELRRRSGAPDRDWKVQQGSLLDSGFLATLGRHDIVYCWGVAHHTGAMWDALGNLSNLVAPGGRLFVAIYNDQGRRSRMWRVVKHAYVRGGPLARPPLIGLSMVVLYTPRLVLMGPRAIGRAFRRLIGRGVGRDTEEARPPRARGMSWWHDLIDWVGGHPFEVAKPEEIFRFYAERGFELVNLQTCGGGLGCNQFVFRLAS